MKKLFVMSAAAVIAATGIAAADVKVGIWDRDGFVDIDQVQDENVELLHLSMPEMEDFVRTRDPVLIITGSDSNRNGLLDQSEFVVAGDISAWDADGDGVLTGTEYQAALMSAGVVTADGSGLMTQDLVGGDDWLAFDVHGENRVSPTGLDAAPFLVRVGVVIE